MEDEEEDKEEGGGVKEPPLTEGQMNSIHSKPPNRGHFEGQRSCREVVPISEVNNMIKY